MQKTNWDNSLQAETISTATDIVVERIREMIIRRELSPGTQLKNNELAERFNMSNTPIREALSRLEKRGLVEYRSRKGWEVKSLNTDEVIQAYDAREYLERLAARCICEQGDQKDFEMLENILSDYLENLNMNNMIECAKLDVKFHRELTYLSHNRYLIEFLDQLMDVIYMTRSMETYEDDNHHVYDEHRNLLDAIEKGDSDAAERCVIIHIRGTRDELNKILLTESVHNEG